METRAQLCDEQPPRVIVTAKLGTGLRVTFEKPTLTDRDIVWIVGAIVIVVAILSFLGLR